MADWRERLLVDDPAIARALRGVRTIAVLGFKNDPGAAAYRIPRYMAARGYRILPVSPKVAGLSLDGEVGRATLADIPEPVDLVDVFRASANIPEHVPEILAMSPLPRLVWLQLGIRNDGAAEALARAGIEVVQDRCLMVEHRRLLGADATAQS